MTRRVSVVVVVTLALLASLPGAAAAVVESDRDVLVPAHVTTDPPANPDCAPEAIAPGGGAVAVAAAPAMCGAAAERHTVVAAVPVDVRSRVPARHGEPRAPPSANEGPWRTSLV